MTERYLLTGGERVRCPHCGTPYLAMEGAVKMAPECCAEAVERQRAEVHDKLTRTYEVVHGLKIRRNHPESLPERVA